jgi:regulator of sirC expression with transglutaminase-like and TPR domain
VRQALDDNATRINAGLGSLCNHRVLRCKSRQSTKPSVSTVVSLAVDVLDFSGDTDDYYNAQNSSIMHVLEARSGIPITLAVAMKLILHLLGYLVHVVGLPGHAVLAMSDGKGALYADVFNGVQFFPQPIVAISPKSTSRMDRPVSCTSWCHGHFEAHASKRCGVPCQRVHLKPYDRE